MNAISDANGANARGHLWYSAGDPEFIEVAGEVTCMNVQGNLATVGMSIDRSKLPGFPGEGNGFLFIITDNSMAPRGHGHASRPSPGQSTDDLS